MALAPGSWEAGPQALIGGEQRSIARTARARRRIVRIPCNEPIPRYGIASPFAQIDLTCGPALAFAQMFPSSEAKLMKIVVVGASGRIGKQLVFNLRQDDWRVLEASPRLGVDAVTGEGLAPALEGADVVVDCSNSPNLEGDAAKRFFETAGRRLTAMGRAAGVKHHIALSIVGTDKLQTSGYFQAKKLQEDIVKASGLPFSLLRSTQFFEFIAGVVQEGSPGAVVMPPAQVQPISGLNVADALADLATGEPLNRTVQVAGPERQRLSEFAVDVLTAYEDPRRVIADPQARYFGAIVTDDSLLPDADARVATLRFSDWLRESLQPEFALAQFRFRGAFP